MVVSASKTDGLLIKTAGLPVKKWDITMKKGGIRYNRQELGVFNIKREGISIKNEGHATYDLMIWYDLIWFHYDVIQTGYNIHKH